MYYEKIQLYRALAALDNSITTLEIDDAKITELTLSDDVRQMEKAVQPLRRATIGPHFMRSLNELSPNKFMWIYPKDNHGDIFGASAVRFDDIGDWFLQRFLIERMRRMVPATDGGYAELSGKTSPFAANIAGRIVYMGDTFVHEDWRSNRLHTTER